MGLMRGFSANLGFLWANLPLPEEIHAARAVGAAAVECHWPYGIAATEVRAALGETGLRMQCLNTRRGKRDGDNGLAAVVGRENEAREAIDEAARLETPVIHVMAGNSMATM